MKHIPDTVLVTKKLKIDSQGTLGKTKFYTSNNNNNNNNNNNDKTWFLTFCNDHKPVLSHHQKSVLKHTGTSAEIYNQTLCTE